MPHVTEEIWSNLPDESRLIVAPWPEGPGETPTPDALRPVQEAAAIFRRSGVVPRSSKATRSGSSTQS